MDGSSQSVDGHHLPTDISTDALANAEDPLQSSHSLPAPALFLDISVDEGWPAGFESGRGERIARAIAEHVEVRSPAICDVALVGDDEVHRLNREFRGFDKPTNVLSFPAPPAAVASDAPMFLGDVILARETIDREAAAQGVEFDAHVTHLIVHGVLHLLGFDHDADAAAAHMEKQETAILAALGIDNPYTEEVVGTG